MAIIQENKNIINYLAYFVIENMFSSLENKHARQTVDCLNLERSLQCVADNKWILVAN